MYERTFIFNTYGKWQPSDMPDLFMHETIAAWVKAYLRKHPFKTTAVSMDQNIATFKKMLKECEVHINTKYEVANLCHDLPKRVRELVEAKGERLPY